MHATNIPLIRLIGKRESGHLRALDQVVNIVCSVRDAGRGALELSRVALGVREIELGVNVSRVITDS